MTSPQPALSEWLTPCPLGTVSERLMQAFLSACDAGEVALAWELLLVVEEHLLSLPPGRLHPRDQDALIAGHRLLWSLRRAG